MRLQHLINEYRLAIINIWGALWPGFSEKFGDSFATQGFFADLEVILFDQMVRKKKNGLGAILSHMSYPPEPVEGVFIKVDSAFCNEILIAPEGSGNWRNMPKPIKLEDVNFKFCIFFDFRVTASRGCEYAWAIAPQKFPAQIFLIPIKHCFFGCTAEMI